MSGAKSEGDACFRSGDFVGAVAHYREALSACTPTAALHCNLALSLYHLTEFRASLQESEAALALQPDYVKVQLA